MARFDERSGQLYVTELGRVASHYYIRHASIVAFNTMLKPHINEAEVRWTCGPFTADCLCLGRKEYSDHLRRIQSKIILRQGVHYFARECRHVNFQGHEPWLYICSLYGSCSKPAAYARCCMNEFFCLRLAVPGNAGTEQRI